MSAIDKMKDISLTEDEKLELYKSLKHEFEKTDSDFSKEDLIKSLAELQEENTRLEEDVVSLRKSMESESEEDVIEVDFDHIVDALDKRDTQVDLMAKAQAVSLDVMRQAIDAIDELTKSINEIKKSLSLPVSNPKSVITEDDVVGKESNKPVAKSEAIQRLSIALSKSVNPQEREILKDTLRKIDFEPVTDNDLKRLNA